MVLCIHRVGPTVKTLLGELSILFSPGLGKPLQVPSRRVRMSDHNQCYAFSRRECQGRLRFEETFFVAGFNNSHAYNHTKSVGAPKEERGGSQAV
jgi:hypothetical protein